MNGSFCTWIILALVVSVVYHVLESDHIVCLCKKYRNACGSLKIQSFMSLFLSTKVLIGLEIAFI